MQLQQFYCMQRVFFMNSFAFEYEIKKKKDGFIPGTAKHKA